LKRGVSPGARFACGNCRTDGCASLHSRTSCRTSCTGVRAVRHRRRVRGQPAPNPHPSSRSGLRCPTASLNCSRSQPHPSFRRRAHCGAPRPVTSRTGIALLSGEKTCRSVPFRSSDRSSTHFARGLSRRKFLKMPIFFIGLGARVAFGNTLKKGQIREKVNAISSTT